MRLARSPWPRAVAVFVAPPVLFAAILGAVNLLGVAPTPTGYYQTFVTLPFPASCNVSIGLPISPTFHGVSFTLQIVEACSPGGGSLNGTVVEANGSTFHFGLAGIPGPSEYVTWFSPDRSCGVEWNRGSTAILLVAS
jgi:hypothetical protein